MKKERNVIPHVVLLTEIKAETLLREKKNIVEEMQLYLPVGRDNIFVATTVKRIEQKGCPINAWKKAFVKCIHFSLEFYSNCSHASGFSLFDGRACMKIYFCDLPLFSFVVEVEAAAGTVTVPS